MSKTELLSFYPENLSELLTKLGFVAQANKLSAYVVGGFVRDLLLQKKNIDLDIVVEGDAGAFANKLKNEWKEWFPTEALPEKVVVYKHYGTAKLIFSEPLLGIFDVLDFSSARVEEYPIAGGKPIIKPGDIVRDLLRRDFTINAIALTIVPENFGKLMDPFSGQDHLKQGIVEVLHDGSFRDDPARIIRGLRFKLRFSFEFSEKTANLYFQARDQKFLSTLPRMRLFDEFRKMLMEDKVDRLLLLMVEEKLLKQIHPLIQVRESMFRELSELGIIKEENWKYILAFLFRDISIEKYSEVLNSFDLTRVLIQDLLEVRKLIYAF